MVKFLIVLLITLVSFSISAGVYWLICWSFDLTFTWKYAFGVWVIWMLVVQVFGRK